MSLHMALPLKYARPTGPTMNRASRIDCWSIAPRGSTFDSVFRYGQKLKNSCQSELSDLDFLVSYLKVSKCSNSGDS